MTTPFHVLQRITADRRPAVRAGERCEMCAEPIADVHQHVVDIEGRQLMCVCRGCYLLFTAENAALRYRAVPDRYLFFPDFTISQGEWDALEIPVGLAFFFRNSALGKTVAFYPGPAGATESELPLEQWRSVLERHPELDALAADVEALLIRVPERGTTDAVCLLLPIDACYEFVGRMRMLWRGFDGGQDVRRYMDEFFTEMSARARPGGVR
ncbi:DUF5947 family protein [Nocardia sp. NBC_01009]|uniref:DUF5947 family protein n=1 Tax=Nocardia sp. NBC_01009 TaxID=2975996 RepID=UPI00386D9759|nr:DUF5947 family protein [Nocardia sp. NBC_01009]